MSIRINVIDVGDMVDLTSHDNGIPYRTKIEDKKGDRLFMAGIPSSGGLPMMLHMDDELGLTFYRETGRYAVRVKVVGFDRKGDVRYVLFTQLTRPEKDQRRMYFRLSVSMMACLYEYIEDIEHSLQTLGIINESKLELLEIVHTKDLSITGVSVLTKHDYEMGTKFILKLIFDSYEKLGDNTKEKPFVVCGEIMRKEYDYVKNHHRIGIHFFGQTQSMSEYLARYVLAEQTKQIKQRRLVEGD